MFGHYLKVALRNATTRKTYSLINVSGLAIGMGCCIVILIYIVTELGYDRYHDNAKNIYRLGANLTLGGTPNAIATTNAPPSMTMVDEYPEVVNAVRLLAMGKQPVRYEDRHFYEERILYADNSIFEVFSFPMIRGNPSSALATANSIVVTEGIAAKYFGDADPMGKTLVINSQTEYTVTGVIRDVRHDSHFVFDMLCSMRTVYDRDPERMESWLGPFVNYAYIQLRDGADPAVLESKFPALVEKYVGEQLKEFGVSVEFFLQPLTRIHLHSNLRHELTANGDIKYIYIFGFTALAILLIACFNFMNLATAWSSTRTKEIGVRKVLGAAKQELVRQFLAESLLYSFAALALALILVHLSLPYLGGLLAADRVARAEGIGSMSVRTLSIDYAATPWLIPAFIGLAALIGIVAGIYPALFLSSFDPSRTLRGGWRGGRGSIWFRRVLVTAQFSISVVLIIATGVVLRQLDHLQQIRLGFDKENAVIIPVRNPELRESLASIKEELRQLPNVVNVGASSHVLGGRPSGGSFAPEGYPEGETEMMDVMFIDDDYLETLSMEIVQGRGFSDEFPADAAESILINEEAARKFGWDEPLGKTIRPASVETAMTVVGVVRDFHFSSPHRRVGPIFISRQSDRFRALYVKIRPTDMPATIEQLQAKWAEFDPDRPFDYYFLDTSYDEQYRAEQNLSGLFGAFSVLAVFLACLGLFGVATFTAEQRTKEIGIRKVLGSSVPAVVYLLSRELIFIGLVASALAWPVAWWLMHRWLEGFPYRAPVNVWMFGFAALLMLAVGFLAVSYQSIRVGLADPVESLRCE